MKFLRRLRSGGIFKSGITSIVIKIQNVLFLFFTSVVLARYMGPEGFGIYSYILSIFMIAGIAIQFGFHILVVREISASLSKNNNRYITGIILFGFMFIGAILLFSESTFLIIKNYITSLEYRSTIFWAYILLPGLVLGSFVGGCLRGFRKVIVGQFPDLIFRPGLLLLFILLLLFLSPELVSKPEQIMKLHALASITSLLVSFYILVSYFNRRVPEKSVGFKPVFWLKSAFPLTLVTVMQMVNSQADVVILGVFAQPSDVGIYRVSSNTSNLIVFGLQAMNMVVAPFFAKYYALNEMEKLKEIVVMSSRVILLVALPVLLSFVFFGDIILKYMFGGDFSGGYLVLIILSVGQMVNALMGSVGGILNMSGHEKSTAYGLMIAAIVNVILNLLLIPVYGITGAAISTATSLSLWNLILWYQVKKHLGINTFRLVFTGRNQL